MRWLHIYIYLSFVRMTDSMQPKKYSFHGVPFLLGAHILHLSFFFAFWELCDVRLHRQSKHNNGPVNPNKIK